MLAIMSPVDQNLILKNFSTYKYLRKSKLTTYFLAFLIFMALVVFLYLLQHPLTNQIPLFTLTNNKPLIVLPETSVTHSHNRENYCVFFPPLHSAVK